MSTTSIVMGKYTILPATCILCFLYRWNNYLSGKGLAKKVRNNVKKYCQTSLFAFHQLYIFSSWRGWRILPLPHPFFFSHLVTYLDGENEFYWLKFSPTLDESASFNRRLSYSLPYRKLPETKDTCGKVVCSNYQKRVVDPS